MPVGGGATGAALARDELIPIAPSNLTRKFGLHPGLFYGRYPDLTIGGPDDAGDDGAFIPSIATEQYGATLARWFGVPVAMLPQVFPNLSAFPVADLGFLR